MIKYISGCRWCRVRQVYRKDQMKLCDSQKGIKKDRKQVLRVGDGDFIGTELLLCKG